MKWKKDKTVTFSRKAAYISLLLMEMVLSGLFGCSKKEEYTVAVAENGTKWESVADGGESAAMQPDAGEKEPALAKEPSSGIIYVDVCGAVRYPGVYELKQDARVFEGIEAAGGLLPEACTKALNQAQVLSDGQKLYVPTTEEWDSADLSGAVLESAQDDGLININTADESRLCELPGVGESRAQAIIQYREEHGPFQSIEEIQNVSGIKSGLFAKIQDLIKVQ